MVLENQIENPKKIVDAFPKNAKKDVESETETENVDEIENLQPSSINKNLTNTRELRNRLFMVPPDYYGNPVIYLAHSVPQDYQEAINSKESEKWRTAMQDEFDSLQENNTWEFV